MGVLIAGKDDIAIVGCMDPAASNYDSLATTACNGCCTYELPGGLESGSPEIQGCTDPVASNFNPSATIDCNGCCQYTAPGGSESSNTFNPGGLTGNESVGTRCSQLVLAITLDGVVVDGNGNNIPEECCTKSNVGGDVTWDKGVCRYIVPSTTICDSVINGSMTLKEFVTRVQCVDCDTFVWWDNLYTSTNGASLRDVNRPLWNYISSLVETTGTTAGSFYVDTLTGDLLPTKQCCNLLNDSTFIDTTDSQGNSIELCICGTIPQPVGLTCNCITSVDEFAQLASSTLGAETLLNTDILVAIGLSLEDANFVINNLYNTNDDNGNGLPDNVDARILLSNALFVSGGVYMCFETDPKTNTAIKTSPVSVTQQKCGELRGTWTGSACLCVADEQCDLSVTQVMVSLETDSFGNNIEVVTFQGETINEACCNKISQENGLGWLYTTEVDGIGRCYNTPPSDCLPVQFNLNERPLTAECPNPLGVSAWLYFGRPDNPCQPYPEDVDDDVVVIPDDGTPCVLTFDSDNNIVEATGVETHLGNQNIVGGTGDSESNGTIELNKLIGKRPDNSTTTDTVCCYNPSVPILGRLVIETETEEIYTPIVEYNSNIDGFETWVKLSTELIPSETLGEFNVKLEFYQGLNCCCVYDIFIDELKVDCSIDEIVTEEIKRDCPGFNIRHVIDNKKSWVYNPGKDGFSRKPDDTIVIGNGDFGLMGGHGPINRTFAPSPDADIPWRYTNYFNQSSIYERHSDLVLNSKELHLTFNMCDVGGPCPEGYTLSGGTEVCYKEELTCPVGYTLSGGTCYSGITTTSATTEVVTTATDPFACKSKLNLLELEGYKKVFQGFWVQFIEQFVPATTIFISGEKWCNRPEDICSVYDECDFDFEFVEGDVTITPNVGGFPFTPPVSSGKPYVPIIGVEPGPKSIGPVPNNSTEDGPIFTDTVKVVPLDITLGSNTQTPLEGGSDSQKQKASEYYDKLNGQPVEIITQ